MSYSFGVRAASKAEAKLKIAAELDKVVASQSIHSRDRDPALAAASAFVDVLKDSDELDVNVSVHGSVSWNGLDTGEIVGAGVGVTASLVTRPAAA